jgi:EAL domain-containing protein (putative c-di-GMP-specific phosphodiesterase class I)
VAGGDELTLAAKARCLLKATSPPVVASGQEQAVHATLGIAVATHGDDAGDLIDAADRARRRARELGADRFEFSELGDQRPESPVRELLDDIHDALGREELRLRYQPTFDLTDRSICGVEALLRWEHPSRTVLAPDMFLPAARRIGAMAPIGRWVLDQSLRQLEHWNEELAREAPLRLFVNLSARELADPSLVDAVGAAVEQAHVSPEQLALDVSDAALIDVHAAAWRSVVALRELGAAIVLDRFATTFSSLAHLERLPIDMVKLDRSCVAGLPDDARERATVKALVGAAEARGLTTIACGVETERQVEALVALGCDRAQGFLLAEPRAARAVTKLLRWRGERTGRAAS